MIVDICIRSTFVILGFKCLYSSARCELDINGIDLGLPSELMIIVCCNHIDCHLLNRDVRRRPRAIGGV